MSKFYTIDIPEDEMTGTQYIIATESNFGQYRDLLGKDTLTFYRLAGRIKASGLEMPSEYELGYALLRLLQEGLIGMTVGGTPVVKFKKLHEDAVTPKYAKPGDAGADVVSVEQVLLGPGDFKLIDLGLSVEIEPGYEIQVRPRSGLAAKYGITVLNAPGTIDSGYRGPCKVILHNTSREPFLVEKGDRVAQFVIKRAPQAVFVEVDELSDTDRGDGGFGSTGA